MLNPQESARVHRIVGWVAILFALSVIISLFVFSVVSVIVE